MADFVSVSKKGFFSRLMESIKGVLVGALLVLVSFPLLWWNEGRAVRTEKGIAEGRGQVVSVQSDRVDAANQGKLVHLTGRAETKKGVRDGQLQVNAPGAIRLERLVEMYQWVEHTEKKTEKKVGGGEETRTEYTYTKEWASRAHDSSNYKVQVKDGERVANPPMPYTTRAFVADDVRIGAFEPNEGLISQLTGNEAVVVDNAMLASLPSDLRGRARISGDAIYVGSDPARPQIGDLRITFKKTSATDVSVLARQEGSKLIPWPTSFGTTINRLDRGTIAAAQMFANEDADNVTMTWVLRLIGFLCMLIGFTLIFRPLSVVADVIPFIGSLVGMGAFIVAFALSAPLSLLTIGIAWLAFRPLLGVLLLAAAAAIFGGLFALSRKRKK